MAASNNYTLDDNFREFLWFNLVEKLKEKKVEKIDALEVKNYSKNEITNLKRIFFEIKQEIELFCKVINEEDKAKTKYDSSDKFEVFNKLAIREYDVAKGFAHRYIDNIVNYISDGKTTTLFDFVSSDIFKNNKYYGNVLNTDMSSFSNNVRATEEGKDTHHLPTTEEIDSTIDDDNYPPALELLEGKWIGINNYSASSEENFVLVYYTFRREKIAKNEICYVERLGIRSIRKYMGEADTLSESCYSIVLDSATEKAKQHKHFQTNTNWTQNYGADILLLKGTGIVKDQPSTVEEVIIKLPKGVNYNENKGIEVSKEVLKTTLKQYFGNEDGESKMKAVTLLLNPDNDTSDGCDIAFKLAYLKFLNLGVGKYSSTQRRNIIKYAKPKEPITTRVEVLNEYVYFKVIKYFKPLQNNQIHKIKDQSFSNDAYVDLQVLHPLYKNFLDAGEFEPLLSISKQNIKAGGDLYVTSTSYINDLDEYKFSIVASKKTKKASIIFDFTSLKDADQYVFTITQIKYIFKKKNKTKSQKITNNPKAINIEKGFEIIEGNPIDYSNELIFVVNINSIMDSGDRVFVYFDITPRVP